MWCVRVHVLVCKELAFETVNWFVCVEQIAGGWTLVTD